MPTSRQVSSAFERAASARGLSYLRDSASEESAAMLVHSGRQDSASEQARRDSASEAGPSRPPEVRLLWFALCALGVHPMAMWLALSCSAMSENR